LIPALTERGLTVREARDAIDAVFDSIKDALGRHERVELPIGSFAVVQNPKERGWRFGKVEVFARNRVGYATGTENLDDGIGFATHLQGAMHPKGSCASLSSGIVLTRVLGVYKTLRSFKRTNRRHLNCAGNVISRAWCTAGIRAPSTPLS